MMSKRQSKVERRRHPGRPFVRPAKMTAKPVHIIALPIWRSVNLCKPIVIPFVLAFEFPVFHDARASLHQD